MLLSVHRQVSNCVHLPFGAEQIEYKWVIEGLFTQIRLKLCYELAAAIAIQKGSPQQVLIGQISKLDALPDT